MDRIHETLNTLFQESLVSYNSQPICWVEPIISKSSKISENPTDNFDNRITVENVITAKESLVIQSPPQFGQTCLARYLALKAWEKNEVWIYIDSKKIKPHHIKKSVKEYTKSIGLSDYRISRIILDGFTLRENNAEQKIKSLIAYNREIPVLILQTIDDENFIEQIDTIDFSFGQGFKRYHLLALSQNQIRSVVSNYNSEKDIGEENVVLQKVVSDLEILNIHRTPLNCLTLLKVSEKYFDESPINRTKFIEQVLTILFKIDEIPTYKSRPDLKDCEYILGRFCENLIRNEIYSFTRENFLADSRRFCKEKLIELDIELVFDILFKNTIIVDSKTDYVFRSSFWIFYFGAKRMYISKDFEDFVFQEKKYVSFPSIVEFYTGIDRTRQNALEWLLDDLEKTHDIVKSKVNISNEFNPYEHVSWIPSDKNIADMSQEISESIQNSNLPETIKDQHADSHYDQIKPYNQSIRQFLQEYSLFNLQQIIKASSTALRNSDYVDPAIKLKLLNKISDSWLQFSKILFAITPILAIKGKANFGGIEFILSKQHENASVSENLTGVFLFNSQNTVDFFKNDISSKKIGPLVYKVFQEQKNVLQKHHLALFIAIERPIKWHIEIDNYIVSLDKNSYYLSDILKRLLNEYRYAFLSEFDLKKIKMFIKKCIAKHQFGDKNPAKTKVNKISDSIFLE